METVDLLKGIMILIGVTLMGLLTKISLGVLEAMEITEEFIKYEPICYMLGGLFFCVGILCSFLTKKEENVELV